MRDALEKWQSTSIVIAVISAVTALAILRQANIDTVIAGLFGIAGLVLGAGAVSHGVVQGSKATTESLPPEKQGQQP